MSGAARRGHPDAADPDRLLGLLPRAGVAGVVLSGLLIAIFSPRPFLAELLDDVTGVTDIHLVLSMQVLAVCAGILMTVGLVAGFVPAWRASRVDPIESLRYE